MKDSIPKKHLRKRLVWQFASFVTVIMVVITMIVTAMLTRALSREQKHSLGINANHSLENIEHRASFLVEKIKDFSKNHFVVNSLIDLEGRDTYLPQMVRDFSRTSDINIVTIVDFEGNAIYSSSEKPPDYKKEIYLRTTLAAGNTISQLSQKQPANVLVAIPIEYYNTPQGAVIAEFNLSGIATRFLNKREIIYYKLYSKENVIFNYNVIENESYISVMQKAAEKHPFMKHLGISLESGAIKSKCLAPVRKAGVRLVLIGFFIIFVSVILAARIGNSIARPILHLCERVKKSEKCNNQKCSPIGTGDELEELAYVFDRRTEQLVTARKNQENYAYELKNNNEQLQKEISERKRAEEGLRKARKNLEKRVEERTSELKKANSLLKLQIAERKRAEEKLKETMVELACSNNELEQFAHVASHDLQEPLRMVASYVQLLERRYKDKLDTDANDFIGFAVEGANRMQMLINDLLMYSSVDTRGNPLKSIDCNTVLDQALVDLSVAIGQSRAVIANDDLPTVMADEVQLIQLFQNLLANAIKYHGENPLRIHISCKQKKNEWCFSISDNGMGIDSKYHERIFVIFQRLHSRNENSGTGIGLAICKRIVERHGGRIWVESESG